MNFSIYPCFKWPGTIWFYSDPHFSDAHLYEYRGMSVEDGDALQVKRINSRVGKGDTIVFLGDIGNIDIVKKIKGYKVLIQGNHDSGASNYLRVVKTAASNAINNVLEVAVSDNRLFDEVYDGTLQISSKILLSHEPVDYKYCLNIHGHDHSGSGFIKQLTADYGCDIPTVDLNMAQLKTAVKHNLKDLNMCAEWLGYYPIALSQIAKSGILKNIPDIHRDTIDTATARRLKS